MTDYELLKLHGWETECESPFEIRHEDGSFATGQAADCVLSTLKEESKIMSFEELALGARFRYLTEKDIWIKISDDGCGSIVEYNEYYIQYPKWTGQKICTFADTKEELKTLKVILMEQ